MCERSSWTALHVFYQESFALLKHPPPLQGEFGIPVKGLFFQALSGSPNQNTWQGSLLPLSNRGYVPCGGLLERGRIGPGSGA